MVIPSVMSGDGGAGVPKASHLEPGCGGGDTSGGNGGGRVGNCVIECTDYARHIRIGGLFQL